MIGQPLKLIEFLYVQDKDKLYEVKEYKKKRNNNQNSRYWKLISELSLKTKISIEDLHFDMLKHYSPRYEILVPADREIRGIEYYEKKSKNYKEWYGVYSISCIYS